MKLAYQFTLLCFAGVLSITNIQAQDAAGPAGKFIAVNGAKIYYK
jgi:hypothetical protein